MCWLGGFQQIWELDMIWGSGPFQSRRFGLGAERFVEVSLECLRLNRNYSFSPDQLSTDFALDDTLHSECTAVQCGFKAKLLNG
jgi:hypothetical protein